MDRQQALQSLVPGASLKVKLVQFNNLLSSLDSRVSSTAATALVLLLERGKRHGDHALGNGQVGIDDFPASTKKTDGNTQYFVCII